MAPRFHGIYAALTTPFVEGDVALDKFKANIRRYNAFGLEGYVVLGSTAENVSLSDDESAGLVRAAKETAAPGKRLIVGTARESTKLTIDFTRRMADLGAGTALVRTPGYYKSRLDAEALRRHFTAVADASPIPVLLYNIPQNTGVAIDSPLVVELSRHPNIAGIKDSSGNLAAVSEVVPQAGRDFDFILGAGSIVLPALLMGASGAILAVANAAPALCVELYREFEAGHLEEARKIQEVLVPLNRAVVPAYGIAGLKYALDLQGYFGGLPRLPLLPVSDKGKAEIETLIKNLGLAAS
jgi:4-hydroxy-2-oxoglutarate aldolase